MSSPATPAKTASDASQPPHPGRADFPHFLAIPTRWMDNDVYGHVNNVVYYSYFDTVINEYLIREGGLDILDGTAIGYCVESHCRYLAPLAFPEVIDAGLRVAHLGTSSVRYEIALFPQGESTPAAVGWFVHVFVDRTDDRPTPLPPRIRSCLERMQR
ncbi:MAG: thioesterase family protein [Sulfuritalea sp.]|nr:thioesterase family protein [Sulfuritalea sp.]